MVLRTLEGLVGSSLAELSLLTARLLIPHEA